MIAILDRLKAYRVAELVTLTRDGAPVCWPMTPYFMDTKVAFATGYVYPSKAINAKRNPNVAVLFCDPTASGRTEADPFTLVQGTAEVLDDLQHNTERVRRSIAGKRHSRDGIGAAVLLDQKSHDRLSMQNLD